MYLQNYYKYNEISFFDEDCDTLRLIAPNANEQVSGVYARLYNGDYLVCFRSDEGIMLQYKGVQFNIDKVTDLEKEGHDYFLKYNGIEMIKDTITPTVINNYLTMEEEDDFNFLLYVYNLSRDKERQSIVFNKRI